MANHQQVLVTLLQEKPPVFVCMGHHKPRLGLSRQVHILKKQALKGYYNLQWAVLPD
jgi:hypothetical protein